MGHRVGEICKWKMEIFQPLPPLVGCVSRKILGRGWREGRGATWRTNPARERQEAEYLWMKAVQRRLCGRLRRQEDCGYSPHPWQPFWFHKHLEAWCLRWSEGSFTASSPEAYSTPSYSVLFHQMIPMVLWKERHYLRMWLTATPRSIIMHLLSPSPREGWKTRLGPHQKVPQAGSMYLVQGWSPSPGTVESMALLVWPQRTDVSLSSSVNNCVSCGRAPFQMA